MTDTMRAAVATRAGGPEVLAVEQVARPRPGEDEVLLAVRAASVNAIDWKIRSGLFERELPAILGSDVCGTVIESHAAAFPVGAEVFGFASSGSYAEFAVARAGAIATRPPGVAAEDAAALPVASMTAWQALFERAAVAAGQRVLVAGAAGGVGHLAVQLARHAGAHVIGTGSARNREFVLGLGAEEYVDYSSEDVGEAVSGVDVAFDTVGGATTEQVLATVVPGGTLVVIAGAPPAEAAEARRVRVQPLVARADPEQLARVAALLDSGEVRVEIAEVLGLEEVRRAHELMQAGHTRGKLVLRVS